jgi:hypothetical protein
VSWCVHGRVQHRQPAGPAGDEPRKVVMAALIGAAEGAEAGKRKTMSKLISLAHKVRPESDSFTCVWVDVGDGVACGRVTPCCWRWCGRCRRCRRI